MEMEVKHALPGICAATVEQVDTISSEAGLDPRCDHLGELGTGDQIVACNVQQIDRMCATDDERVTVGYWIDVHESDCSFGLGDCR